MPTPRRNKNTVALPLELWWYIIQIATAVPGLFDVEVADPFGPASPSACTLWDSAGEKRATIAAQQTKLSLLRVSRGFHTLAMPLLYESLYLQRDTALAPLLRTLERSQQRAAHNGTRALGSYTRRLDFSLLADYWALEVEDAVHGRHLVGSVIACLPNLEIFNALWTSLDLRETRVSSMLTAALSTACSDTLRKIALPYPPREWEDVTFPSDMLSLQYEILASTAPGLHTLFSDGTPKCCPFSRKLPRTLTFMTIAKCPRYHGSPAGTAAGAGAPYPSLTQVSIRDPIDRDMHCLLRFLTAQGPLLTTVYIKSNFDRSLGRLFAALQNSCSNLQHVVLVLGRWPQIALPLVHLPALTHLGLYLPDTGLDNERDDFLEWIRAMDAPALRLVRFMNPKHLEDLRVGHTQVWIEGMQGLAGRQLRFEDPEGGLLNPDGHSLPS